MLLFVYNADAGRLNALLDTAHKLLSPATYECRLCELSYGLVKENAAWKAFRETLEEPVTFLHRDEYEAQYAAQADYPVLLRVEGDELEVLLDASAISAASDTDDLIRRCRQAIAPTDD